MFWLNLHLFCRKCYLLRLHLRGLRTFLRCRRNIFCPVIFIAESCNLQSIHNLIACGKKICWRSNDIGQIQYCAFTFLCIGQPEDSSYDLLHINDGISIRYGSQNIGKGTVPAFFQRIHCHNVTDRARSRHQILIPDIVLICSLYRNFFLWNSHLH